MNEKMNPTLASSVVNSALKLFVAAAPWLAWRSSGRGDQPVSGSVWSRGYNPEARARGLIAAVDRAEASIDVRLADGTSLPARIIDTGDARASFFVAIWSAPSRWEALIARDAAGAELETYRRR